MMLRASSSKQGGDADIAVITAEADSDGGVAHGRAIIDLVDAVLDAGHADSGPARERLAELAGAQAVADVGAVLGMFHLNDRVADATGAPIDEFGFDIRMKVGETLGISPPP